MAGTPASATDVTVRTFRPEDEAGLLQLLALAFDGWPHREVAVEAAAYLHWKLRNSKEALHSHTVAEANGTIVGCRLFRLFDIHSSIGPLRGCWGFDAAVHPDYRGLGVMTRLRDLAIERHRGFVDLQIGGYSRIEAMQRVHSSEERHPFGNSIELLERPRGATRPGDGPAWTIEAPAAFGERLDAFWEQARLPFSFAFVRDRATLNWRYMDVRGGTFRVRTTEERGAMSAYVVCKREHDKGYMVDLLALPDRLDALDALVADAVAYYDAEGAEAIRCWLPKQHMYRAVLERHGFARRRTEKTLAWGPLRTPKRELAFLSDDPQAAIHLTMGDSDLI